jgi:hypothetical protein
MKLTFEIDLGEVEVDTNSEHGSIDAVWVNGENLINKTVEEFLIEAFGGQRKWTQKVADEQYSRSNPSERF